MIHKQRCSGTGYDSEELYFEKLNRELIQKLHSNVMKATPNTEHAQNRGAQVLQFPKHEDTQKQKKAA